jgi:hypothetical protein
MATHKAKAKAEPDTVQKVQGPGKPNAPATRTPTQTAPTAQRATADSSPAPVNSVTHPPGADER